MLITYYVESRPTGAGAQLTFNVRSEQEGLAKLKYQIRKLRRVKDHPYWLPIDAKRGLTVAVTFMSEYDLR